MQNEQLEALKFLTNRYIENVWKHTGIHLIGTGWILSSIQLQSILSKSVYVQLGLTIAFIILQSVHSFINIPIYKQIKELESNVDVKNGDNISSYYGVSKSRFVWNELMIFCIAFLAVIFIWTSPCI
jgi:hypothetical protein